MEKYNLVNRENAVRPNYPLIGKDISLLLYFSPGREVCIAGQFDNNYAFWVSFSNLDNVGHNTAIFDFIFKNEHQHVISNWSWARELKHEYGDVRDWLTVDVRKQHFSPNEMRYRFPTGVFFGGNNHDNAKSLAMDIRKFFQQELDKCKYRLANPLYSSILKTYREILSQRGEDDYRNYVKMEPLISIIKAERYLLISLDEAVRSLYLSCVRKCNNLYNRYMTSIR